MRKFGVNILQHPRGVCVDSQGRIIVVEFQVMRVIIFDSYENVLQKFSCFQYLEFPNGVCAAPNDEIVISDYRAHCIQVFSYEGQYLRQIGGEGITNYPIGVGMNSNGEVIVADNHNSFNLTIFDQGCFFGLWISGGFARWYTDPKTQKHVPVKTALLKTLPNENEEELSLKKIG
uniref:Uncharacterized protein n=1 Tax=Panagrolaimus davidi TaxID=227884 RepID=A0A914P6N1_9BILA